MTYGSAASPVPMDPWKRITGVHWAGGVKYISLDIYIAGATYPLFNFTHSFPPGDPPAWNGPTGEPKLSNYSSHEEVIKRRDFGGTPSGYGNISGIRRSSAIPLTETDPVNPVVISDLPSGTFRDNTYGANEYVWAPASSGFHVTAGSGTAYVDPDGFPISGFNADTAISIESLIQPATGGPFFGETEAGIQETDYYQFAGPQVGSLGIHDPAQFVGVASIATTPVNFSGASATYKGKSYSCVGILAASLDLYTSTDNANFPEADWSYTTVKILLKREDA